MRGVSGELGWESGSRNSEPRNKRNLEGLGEAHNCLKGGQTWDGE